MKMQQNEGLGPELLQEFISLYGGFNRFQECERREKGHI